MGVGFGASCTCGVDVGRWDSCSALEGWCVVLEVVCGRDATIMSYAEGARSTNEASSCDDVNTDAPACRS